VSEGAFRSRAEAVRAGIELLQRQLLETRIADSYRAAYTSNALTADETRALDAAASMAGGALA
jgi:Arc/MetJ-type ribon-helix-helix transcriptional regulator